VLYLYRYSKVHNFKMKCQCLASSVICHQIMQYLKFLRCISGTVSVIRLFLFSNVEVGVFVRKIYIRRVRDFDVLLTVHLSIFISVINQLDEQSFCFTIRLFHASRCFEHMCSSSGGQNCITQPLVSSHLRGCVMEF